MIQVTEADRPSSQTPPSSLVTHLYRDNVPCLVSFFLVFPSPPTCPLHPIVLGLVAVTPESPLEVFGAREARRFYRRGFRCSSNS